LVGVRTGTFWNISLRQVIQRSSIAEPLYPRRGSKFSLAGQFTLPYSTLGIGKQNFQPSDIQAIIDVEQENCGSGCDFTQDDIDRFVNQAIAAQRFKLLEYHKWRFDAEWYYNIWDKLVFATSAKVGVLGFYNKE